MSRRMLRIIGATTVAALLAGSLSADVVHASRHASVERSGNDKPIDVKLWRPAAPAKPATARSAVPAPRVWPAGQQFDLNLQGEVDPGSATTSLTPAASGVLRTPGWAAVGTSGIAVGNASTSGSAGGDEMALSGVATAAHVRVEVLGGDGVTAPTLKISQLGARTGLQSLAIDLPARALAGLYGADYANRLRWVQVANPHDAALPSVQASLHGQPITRFSSGVLRTTSSPSYSIFVTGLSSGSSATGTGDFTATPLHPASSWQVSAQTGAFDWNYPMRVPPAAAGPAPSLALSYDSQSVDGDTGSTNNQPTAIGDGWSLAGAGSIDRSYTPCTLAASAVQSGDLCWLNDNATVSFAGHSGRLVKDSTSGAWRLESDDNTKIEYLTSGAGDTVGHWKLTTTDGTQYFFGLGTLPGGASTHSAWTVPVCGTASAACASASSVLTTQAWRWNLDYVLDVHNNAEALYYNQEAGSYVRTSDSSGSPQTLTSYVRGGQLARIDYGIRATSTSLGTPSDQVALTYQDRCEVGVSGEGTNDCDVQPATTGTSGTAQYWPDVPWDQLCRSGTVCSVQSPTFWTTKRLASVQTQYLASGSTYHSVDQWNLTHTFPTTGDGGKPVLWLAGVTHTGQAGSGGDLTLPATTFGGLDMQNRVWQVDGLDSLDRFRINTIHTESGAVVSVTYSSTANNRLQCSASPGGTPSDPATDAMLCYQQWWTPPQAPNVPPPAAQEDWFNTYVVMQVATDPGAGQDSDLMNYVYSQPAWRFDTSPMSAASQRTWSDFAGFHTVEVQHGDTQYQTTHPVQSTTYTFLQGLDGDPNGPLTAPSSSHRSVTTTINGVTVHDYRWLAGRTLETVVHDGVGGGPVSDTITIPWSSPATATSTFTYTRRTEHDGSSSTTYSGSFTTTARHSGDDTVTTTIPLAAGGNRTTVVTNTHDGNGRVTQSETKTTDVGTSCTLTDYADNTSVNLLDLADDVRVLAEPCATAASTPDYLNDGLSETRTSYDGLTYGATPTTGDVTQVDSAKTFTSSGWGTSVHIKSTYDTLGRVLTTTDALNHLTGYSYVPVLSGPLTSETVTNPKLWTTVTSYDPSSGSPTSITDINSRVSTAQYDSLGRLTQDWAIGNPYAANPTSPSHTYAYTYPTGSAVAATSTTASGGANVQGSATTLTPFATGSQVSVASTHLIAGGTQTPISYTLYDGLLRQRQTQSVSPTNTGAVLTDTFYNNQGEVGTSYAPYWANHAVTGTLLQPVSAAQIPSQTITSYDGAGRTLQQQLYTADPAPGATGPQVTGAQTSWAYPGSDRTDMTPPSGAAITSTFTDSLGRTSELRQFHGPLNATTRNQRSSYDRTQYRYDLKGEMTSMTDDAGNAWNWQYDILGRQTQTVDPDKGTTTSTYNDGGLLRTTTDKRTSFINADGSTGTKPAGVTLDYTYDELNRKTGEFLDSDSGVQLAGWKYDVVGDGQPDEHGQLVSSTRYTADSTGPAFTSQITSFDHTSGLPTSTAVIIPQELADATELTPFAGMLQQLAGTYASATTYNRDGSVHTQVEPAAGDLEEDNLVSDYDNLGNLTSVHGGTLYANTITRTGIGQLAQIRKSATTTSTIGYSYDPATGRTTGISEAIESALPPLNIAAGTPVTNRVYGYDPAGDVTSENDTVTGDSQCFTYDYAQHLQDAWSQNTGTCQSTPSSGVVGGPAPYWQSYTYDSIGDRTSQIQHSTSGGSDTTNTYNYNGPAVNGTPLPNAVSSIGHAGGTTGTDTYTYDATGNTLTRPGQNLSYDAEGHLARATSGTSTERDIYDADGNRLLQINNTGTSTADATLYLGDTELHVSLAQTQVIGTRTYTVLGQPVAIRVATPGGTYPTNLYWTGLDNQQTPADSIRTNTTTTSAITRRYLDPFGNPRGTPPSTWPNQHGFLNAPTDTLTNTTHLGARDYDPTTGRFLTVDPVLDPQSPQSLNGYAYANNNPASASDPSGLHTDDPSDCNSACGYDNSGNYDPSVPDAGGYVPPPGNNAQNSSTGHGSFNAGCSWYNAICGGKKMYYGAGGVAKGFGLSLLSGSTSHPSINPALGSIGGDTTDTALPVLTDGVMTTSNLLLLGDGIGGISAAMLRRFLAEEAAKAAVDGARGGTVATGASAADTAGNAGDHIVLGIDDEGLAQTASKVGGRTLMKDPQWRSTLQSAIGDPSSKFTVSLDGMLGNGTYSQVMSAAQRGAAGAGGNTDWEMAQLLQGGRLPDVTFVRGGSAVDNPFG